ncbi:hypothetical protein H7K45_00520 [Mycobacterium yunnanensis]|uniref:Secreted protein n=1 Tax=Mycobacterium yunnanensis TaxID=368477 RepID=A0A9X3BYE2_9MYCO|nr:hypothetical protein [Mycobacterium yunnanensis]MCV7419018.1 hypothetical protein [Mycobacterium yunnanensis]
MLRTVALGTLATALALSSIAVASADPAQPPCTAATKDALTWPTGAAAPLTCDGATWQPVTDPYPMSDEWASPGPTMTLHGQGRRNPMLESGQWTATPLAPDTSCAATQFAVVSGTPTLSAPQSDRGEPGQPLSLEMVPRLFTVELSGDCLWRRTP